MKQCQTVFSWAPKSLWTVKLKDICSLEGKLPSKLLWKENYGKLAAAAKSLQSCLILCDSIDGSPPGSSIPGILKARTLEWVQYFFLEIRKFIERCNDSYSGHLGSQYSEQTCLNIFFHLLLLLLSCFSCVRLCAVCTAPQITTTATETDR